MARSTPAALRAKSPNAQTAQNRADSSGVLVVALGVGQEDGVYTIEAIDAGAEVSTGVVINISHEQWRQWQEVEQTRDELLEEFDQLAQKKRPRR